MHLSGEWRSKVDRRAEAPYWYAIRRLRRAKNELATREILVYVKLQSMRPKPERTLRS
jgi:hypothetical protein